ncbi:MAG: small ribosomal subunit Rsm22 family protein, partial [Spirochaetota bacterium]
MLAPARTPCDTRDMNQDTHEHSHRHPAPQASLHIIETSQAAAPEGSAALVSILMDIIEETAPMPGGRRQDLRHDVLELWRELTSERSVRQADYIGEPAKYAAYLRYFLPWNVVRLIPILASIPLDLKAGDRLLDIGSGPLTLPIALWIARPELRGVPLELLCVDRVRRVAETGLTILNGLALRADGQLAWKVETRKATFPKLGSEDTSEHFKLVTAANVFNESFWKDKQVLSDRAGELAGQVSSHLVPGGRILVVEPGDPRSGAMLSALRESIILRGGQAVAPCPHQAACPMSGVFLSAAFRKDKPDTKPGPVDRVAGLKAAREAAAKRVFPIPPVVTAHGRSKAPWCHFVLDRSAAPARLTAFSETTGLPKDRLIASWLYAEPLPPARQENPAPAIRIISDPFRLGDSGQGRYACCRTGYTLAKGDLALLPSGFMAVLDSPLPGAKSEKDTKSGAVIIQASFAPGTAPTLPPQEPPSHGTRARPDKSSKADADRPVGAGSDSPGRLGTKGPRRSYEDKRKGSKVPKGPSKPQGRKSKSTETSQEDTS